MLSLHASQQNDMYWYFANFQDALLKQELQKLYYWEGYMQSSTRSVWIKSLTWVWDDDLYQQAVLVKDILQK